MRLAFLAVVGSLLFAVGCCSSGCITTSYAVTKLYGEVLSTHETRAVFGGIKEAPCRHMTALCPNRCDHGGTYAIFSIEEYLKYQKIDQYGEEHQSTFYVSLTNGRGERSPGTSEALETMIKSLKENDKVILHWAHIYVRDEYVSEPRRVVTFLQ